MVSLGKWLVRNLLKRIAHPSCTVQADESRREKRVPPFSDLIADGTLTIVAGADTTATVLTAFFYYLLSNPRYISALRDEVDDFFERGLDIFSPTKDDGELSLMTACMSVYTSL